MGSFIDLLFIVYDWIQFVTKCHAQHCDTISGIAHASMKSIVLMAVHASDQAAMEEVISIARGTRRCFPKEEPARISSGLCPSLASHALG